MQQDTLFHDSFRAALAHAVNALGGCASVGARLWPTKELKRSEQKLANCLNPDHDWKLDLDEIQAILSWAREAGVHCAIHQLCDETGYTRPEISPGKTKHQQLASQYAQHAAEMVRLADELAAIERAETMAEIRAVK